MSVLVENDTQYWTHTFPAAHITNQRHVHCTLCAWSLLWIIHYYWLLCWFRNTQPTCNVSTMCKRPDVSDQKPKSSCLTCHLACALKKQKHSNNQKEKGKNKTISAVFQWSGVCVFVFVWCTVASTAPVARLMQAWLLEEQWREALFVWLFKATINRLSPTPKATPLNSWSRKFIFSKNLT